CGVDVDALVECAHEGEVQSPASLLRLLGQVARHQEEAAHLAVLAMYGSNRDARPEPAAVLADLPRLMHALGVHVLDGACHGPSTRVQHGIMPPNHPVRLMAKDALCAGVPAEYVSGGVDDHQRLVERPVHQSAKAFF